MFKFTETYLTLNIETKCIIHVKNTNLGVIHFVINGFIFERRLI